MKPLDATPPVKRHISMESKVWEFMDAVDSVCRTATRKRRVIGGRVNWSDLGCEVAGIYHDGKLWCRLTEASPDAKALQEYVAAKLKRTWGDVYVETDW